MESKLPENRWHTLAETAELLDLTKKEFRQYVEAGLFPQGVRIRRDGKQVLVWSQEDLVAMQWIKQHKDRFAPKKPVSDE